ncbi:Uncharacterized protein BP5553_09767 [Venustampulla echinocandica]|uniref:DUF221-domain-containing protein n=1 Tax=Venustampulla echinocandica TaxID=2656787 RepID=A0A370TBX9_9HELO|nr:Uncharacterized protein BP5553_09767 [Venustampulla echinocandica]RDL31558.1 Uncharacterized protein BP5553_09767 [Venustampulla echinocandica]
MDSNIGDILDSAAGKAQKAQGESLSTFLASLTTSAIILGLGAIAYSLLNSRIPEYYSQSRQTSDSEWKPVSLSPRMLVFPGPDPHLKHPSNLDNYFFDRYLHTITRIFLLLGLTVPPLLIPLNVVDGKDEIGGVKGLDRLSFSNVSFSHTDRYWVHLGVAIFVVTSVCHVLRREVREYARIQSVSHLCVRRSSLLITSSIQQPSSKAIRRHFRKTAGGIRSITINRDYSDLQAKLRRRDASLRNLEIAETSLIMKANYKKRIGCTKDKMDAVYRHPMPLWMKYLDQKDRASVRLPKFPWLCRLPFVGAQVDAIRYFRTEVAQLNIEIERDQEHPEKFPQTTSSLVHFNQSISTQLATIALEARIPPSWTLKHGTTPSDTIWPHVSISWWRQCIRTAVVYLLVTALILGFAVPVTIIGSLSQIKYLTNVVPWLQRIGSLPIWLVAVIQGVLPPILLAVATAAVPILIRFLTNLEGLHSRQATENHIQIYYFAFLFVQGFLTISLSAGITTIVGELSTTVQAVPAVLAQNLPKACNYFFSYIIMSAVTAVVCTLIRVNQLLNLFVLSPMLDKSARQKWVRGENVRLRKWGTLMPVLTNVACIGLIYSVIAPLILIFSGIYFGALWILYRSYPPKLTESDIGTSGLFYPTAIHQLFTGIYFMELCLAGLFFLVRDADGRAACTTQATIMIVVTALTTLFHYTIDSSHWIRWLRLDALKQKIERIGGQGKDRREVNELSTTNPRILQPDPVQDEALVASRPVVWIPKDKLGVSDDEISHVRRAYESIWISNEGASLDERGKLKLWCPPP